MNNNGNYTPKNCCWATSAQNNQNKSNNKLSMKIVKKIRKRYKAGGILYRELALIYGVTATTIGNVVRRERWR